MTKDRHIRFKAEWISRQHEINGEWSPDQDEYSFSLHHTRRAAERAAVKESKKAGYCEWISVTEQELRPRGNLPRFMEWADVTRWTGDWHGLCEQIALAMDDEPSELTVRQ